MPAAIQFTGVVKDFRGLRPLRVRDLVVGETEIVSLVGLDLQATEVFTGLVTGAILPDQGRVIVLGEDTATVADPDQWLAGLDRYGIVSDRVALLDGFTVAQNIALSLTMDLEPMPEAVLAAVQTLAAETGLEADRLSQPAVALDALDGFRVRLARAVANSPRLIVVEHPGQGLEPGRLPALASDLSRLVRGRRVAAVIVSAHAAFGRIADRQLVLDPATGATRGRGLRAWFS